MTQPQSIPTWVEENRALHDSICLARASVDAADELNHQLQMNKQKFVNLLDNEAKNPSHRATLNSSKFLLKKACSLDKKKKIAINTLHRQGLH